MKKKLKKSLVVMIIIITTFCVMDNSFIIGKFFTSVVINDVYAINTDDSDDSQGSNTNTTTVDPAVQEFKNKMVEIARAIANDTYTDSAHSEGTEYTYLWGGDGEYRRGSDGRRYCVFDCRGLVAGSIRYASTACNFHTDVFSDFFITSTRYEFGELTKTGLWGCHKVTSSTLLQDGDILLNPHHTELFFREPDGTPKQVGAWQTSRVFEKDESCGGGYGDCDPTDSITERDLYTWDAYFRFGTITDYYPKGRVSGWNGNGDSISGQLGEGRWYTGEVDDEAELDEQIFDFQGNPQQMVYDGEAKINFWLFTLLSQFIDFMAGLLVSLLINPIMQLLNAIVNFLTNLINKISGVPVE